MTLCEHMTAKVGETIAKRLVTPDNILGLSRVTIIIQINPKTLEIGMISWRPEYQENRP